LTSTIPLKRILIEGNAKNGKKRGIRCGFLNLQPASIMVLEMFKKSDATLSNESVEIIPPNCSEREANVFPSFITIKPPCVLIKLFTAVAMSASFEPITIMSFS